ncbi:MAG: hypothetical protein IJ202_08805 [Bacteroidales bacterium]|nr:hypothetical protein [Bacteroidales bacterium]
MLSSIIDLLDWLLDLEIAGIPVGLFIIMLPVIYLFWKCTKWFQSTYTDPLLDAYKKFREENSDKPQEEDSDKE